MEHTEPLKPHSRFIARVSPPATSDPCAVSARVWDALLEEALLRLKDVHVAPETVFAGIDRADSMPEWASQIARKWISDGLSAERALQIAEELRKAAFDEQGDPGPAPLEMAGERDESMGMLTALAAVLDYLALLAGPQGLIQFQHEEVEG